MEAAFVYVDTLKEELIALRREFHQHPEILFDVDRTAAKVARYLKDLGLEVHEQVGKHFGKGVVAMLDSGRPGPTIVLRADMDALPITEENTADYRSKYEGVMHACGHDAHMTMLLGAAKALSRHLRIFESLFKVSTDITARRILPWMLSLCPSNSLPT
jgi:amidohydrolase